MTSRGRTSSATRPARSAAAIDPIQEEVFVVLDGTLTIHMGEGDAPEQHELGRGSVLIVQPGTALQLSNRHRDDELRLFVYGAPPERGERRSPDDRVASRLAS